jgi:2-keto-3-deoxy-6-phosphogluconate aldolase
MRKLRLIQQIVEEGLVPVLRGDSAEHAVQM